MFNGVTEIINWAKERGKTGRGGELEGGMHHPNEVCERMVLSAMP